MKERETEIGRKRGRERVEKDKEVERYMRKVSKRKRERKIWSDKDEKIKIQYHAKTMKKSKI